MPIKESISATHQLCQELTTLIDEQLSAFFADLDEATKGPKAAVSINLNTQQLALLAALYPSKGKTKRLIVDGSSEKNTDLLTTISAWTMSAGIDDSWRILNGSLTPQEMNGSIVSNLSQTMHSFLAKLMLKIRLTRIGRKNNPSNSTTLNPRDTCTNAGRL